MDDHLKLKAELLVEGIMADVECLAGFGKEYKEQNHGLFVWDFEDHPETLLPDDFCLHKQCLFCNLVATSATYNSVLKKKDITAIGEEAQSWITWSDTLGK